MKVLFHVFGLPIGFFGVMIALGILGGLYVAYLSLVFIIGAFIVMSIIKRNNKFIVIDEQDADSNKTSGLIIDILVTVCLIVISVIIYYLVQG